MAQRIETNTSTIDGYITSSKLTYNGNGVLTEHTETVGIRTDYYNTTTGKLQSITINVPDLTGTSYVDVDTTYAHISGSNVVTSFQTTKTNGTISDTNTFNNLGVLIAKLHTETGKSNSTEFNANGTKKTTIDTTTNSSTGQEFSTKFTFNDSGLITEKVENDGIKKTTTTYQFNDDGTYKYKSAPDDSTLDTILLLLYPYQVNLMELIP